MAQERANRKLAAILSADVKGYSRLMGEDEVATVETLKKFREIIGKLVLDYRGRVVDSPGDNILSEFSSVVDAVECGVKIQERLKRENASLQDDRRMQFRIGINLGDVIEDESRIYGDGINVAARVEGLAEGGGVCISGTAFDQIGKKLPLGYEYLGEQEVKNIEKPVRAYRVLTEAEFTGRVIGEETAKPKPWRWAGIAIMAIIIVGAWAIWNFHFRPPPIQPASVEKMAFPLPEKPSIAVLPFENLSDDPTEDYLSDGITENTIVALSQVSEMFVIARNSTFAYKGKPIKVQKVAEDLGVRYVLEGSVQRSGDRIRVTAQLIDATKGHHLWAERYDRHLKDLFAVQDDITKEIVVALQVQLTLGEQARIWHRSTNNLSAWSHFVKAYTLFERFTRADNEKARKLFHEAVRLDPEYDSAWTLIGWTHWVDARFGFSKNPAESFRKSVELATKALEMDPDQPNIHALWGGIHLFQRRYEEAIASGEKAIELGPNNSEIHALLAMSVHYSGDFQRAIRLIKKAIRLNPRYPNWYLTILGDAYYMSGEYNNAIETYNHMKTVGLKQNLKPFFSNLGLAASYMSLGQEDKARAFAQEVQNLDPQVSLELISQFHLYKDPEHLERYLINLRKAGIPDNPPLPLPDKPAIAVLPFENMSGDPEQEYFSDGITEEIITALANIPQMFVIARTSSFKYKGKEIDLRTVGRELGVQYVLEGSVRKAGDDVRITAQLIDAKTNNHVWAERYDLDINELFAVQDKVTKKVVTALQVKLTEGERARVFSRGTNNLEAYLKLLKGREQMNRWNNEGNALARQTIKEVISLDPHYANAYYLLAILHNRDVFTGFTNKPKASITNAIKLTKKAIALDESLVGAYGLLGWLYTVLRQHEKGIAQAEKALALNPNPETFFWMGLTLGFSGRHEEAIGLLKKAVRLNPFPANPVFYLHLAIAYRDAERYEEAIPICKKILRQEPDYIFAHTALASCYAQMGRTEEARAEAEEVLRIAPEFSVDSLCKRLPYKHDVDRNRVRNSLLKAGLPE